MTNPVLWCSYCRKATHSDEECTCTRPEGWAEARAQAFSRTQHALFDAMAPSKRDHILSAACWCFPTLEYRDPINKNGVYVHHEPQ